MSSSQRLLESNLSKHNKYLNTSKNLFSSSSSSSSSFPSSPPHHSPPPPHSSSSLPFENNSINLNNNILISSFNSENNNNNNNNKSSKSNNDNKSNNKTNELHSDNNNSYMNNNNNDNNNNNNNNDSNNNNNENSSHNLKKYSSHHHHHHHNHHNHSHNYESIDYNNDKKILLSQNIRNCLEDSFIWGHQLKIDSFNSQLHSTIDWQDNNNLPINLYLVRFKRSLGWFWLQIPSNSQSNSIEGSETDSNFNLNSNSGPNSTTNSNTNSNFISDPNSNSNSSSNSNSNSNSYTYSDSNSDSETIVEGDFIVCHTSDSFDIGVVQLIYSSKVNETSHINIETLGEIVGLASLDQMKAYHRKLKRESSLLELCRSYLQSITNQSYEQSIIDLEFQIDGKIFLYYDNTNLNTNDDDNNNIDNKNNNNIHHSQLSSSTSNNNNNNNNNNQQQQKNNDSEIKQIKHLLHEYLPEISWKIIRLSELSLVSSCPQIDHLISAPLSPIHPIIIHSNSYPSDYDNLIDTYVEENDAEDFDNEFFDDYQNISPSNIFSSNKNLSSSSRKSNPSSKPNKTNQLDQYLDEVYHNVHIHLPTSILQKQLKQINK